MNATWTFVVRHLVATLEDGSSLVTWRCSPPFGIDRRPAQRMSDAESPSYVRLVGRYVIASGPNGHVRWDQVMCL